MWFFSFFCVKNTLFFWSKHCCKFQNTELRCKIPLAWKMEKMPQKCYKNVRKSSKFSTFFFVVVKAPAKILFSKYNSGIGWLRHLVRAESFSTKFYIKMTLFWQREKWYLSSRKHIVFKKILFFYNIFLVGFLKNPIFLKKISSPCIQKLDSIPKSQPQI